jgi:hypothetical protein
MDHQALLVPQVLVVTGDLLARLGLLVAQGMLVTKVLWEILDQLAKQGSKDKLAQQVPVDPLVQLEKAVLGDKLVKVAKQDLLVHQAQLAHLVLLDHLDLRVRRDHKDQQDPGAQQDHQDLQVH